MKRLLQSYLRYCARWVLWKYHPAVIGITGSVGKTSTKETVTTVLAGHGISVRASQRNYNNEIGVPLAILGIDTGGKSVVRWLRVFLRVLRLLLLPIRSYPKVLVLEMGADHPGDVRYLAALAEPRIGIVTAVAPVHVETLGTLDRIAREKCALVQTVAKDGLVILNGDDAAVLAMKERAKGRVVTYGLHEENDVRAIEIQYNARVEEGQTKVQGITMKLVYNGSAVPVLIPGVLGVQAVYAALAATAVGIEYGLHLVGIASALAHYTPPPGRLRVLDGIKHTTLLDDTYNASPRATEVALQALAELPRADGVSKWVILGDMLELGSMAEEAHRTIGAAVTNQHFDYLVTVGEQSRDIDCGAREAGMAEDRIFHFASAQEAGRFVQGRMKKGDLLLIKGSQGVRMERIVKELMADPAHAKDLLVRQGKEWV